MKKVFTVIIVLSMIVMLCACGTPSIGDIMYEKYGSLIDQLEAEEYEDAVHSVFSMMPEGESKYGSLFDKLSREDYDGAIEEVEALKPVPEKLSSHEVNITMGNWEEYFEIVEIPRATAFGKLDSVMIIFRFKDEYKDKVDYDNEFKIDISYINRWTGDKYYKYIYETNKVEYNDWKSKSNTEWNETYKFTNLKFKDEADFDYSDYSLWNPCAIFGANAENDYIHVHEIKIDDIKGSIYLYD